MIINKDPEIEIFFLSGGLIRFKKCTSLHLSQRGVNPKCIVCLWKILKRNKIIGTTPSSFSLLPSSVHFAITSKKNLE